MRTRLLLGAAGAGLVSGAGAKWLDEAGNRWGGVADTGALLASRLGLWAVVLCLCVRWARTRQEAAGAAATLFGAMCLAYYVVSVGWLGIGDWTYLGLWVVAALTLVPLVAVSLRWAQEASRGGQTYRRQVRGGVVSGALAGVPAGEALAMTVEGRAFWLPALVSGLFAVAVVLLVAGTTRARRVAAGTSLPVAVLVWLALAQSLAVLELVYDYV